MVPNLLNRLTGNAWFWRQVESNNWRLFWRISQVAFAGSIIITTAGLYFSTRTSPWSLMSTFALGFCAAGAAMNCFRLVLHVQIDRLDDEVRYHKAVNAAYSQKITSLQEELHQAKCADVDDGEKDRSSHDDLNQEDDVADKGLFEELLGVIGFGKKKDGENPSIPKMPEMVKLLVNQLVDERIKHMGHVLSSHDIPADNITAAAMFRVAIGEFVLTGMPLPTARAQFQKIWDELSEKKEEHPFVDAQNALLTKLRKELSKRAKEAHEEAEASAAAEKQTVVESSSVKPEPKYQPPRTETIPSPGGISVEPHPEPEVSPLEKEARAGEPRTPDMGL